jgi:hypothetical protein
MSDHEDAKTIFEFIKGTAIADLRSQVNWVRDSRNEKVPPPTDGQLNFALALHALIICESCGFYMLGASRTPNDFEKERADLGIYVMEFIQERFERHSSFKHLVKVLADFLRHALVHGYGSYTPKLDFGLDLFISLDMNDRTRAVEETGIRKIRLNSLALADETIRAFEEFLEEVNEGKNAEQLSNIVRARDHEVKVSESISNQFNVVFEKLIRA